MKRFVNSKSIPLLVLLSSLAAMLLRIWTRGSGPDAEGLFAPKPLVWGLLWLLTLATAAAILFAVWRLRNSPEYRDNYPKSVISGLCAVPAALCMLVVSYHQLRDSVALVLPQTTAVDTITGIFGLVAGLCLLLSAVHRCMGKKPFFVINGLICIYFALRLFNCCQIWSNEPKIGIVVFPFLASMTLMLGSYQRVCFDVDLGNRRWSALWCLMSVYLCVVAMFSFEQTLFYGLCALWQIGDLCSLRPLKKRKPRYEISEEAQTPEAGE